MPLVTPNYGLDTSLITNILPRVDCHQMTTVLMGVTSLTNSLLVDNHRRNLQGVRGVQYRTFHDEKVKDLLSPAVNRGDLWRLKPFLPLGTLTTFSQTPESDEEGDSPHLSPRGPNGPSFSF